MHILEQIARYAATDRIAFLYEEQSLSYAGLEARSNAFADYLLNTLGEDRSPVLIYGHKELSIPPCLFGALKAGRGYVPLDVSYPPERVRQIADELKPSLVIDLQGAGLSGFPVLGPEALEQVLSAPCAAPDPSFWLKADQVAYILFTSGSTGRPKGVPITAGNIQSFLTGAARYFGENEGRGVFLNAISYSFDVSVCALYYALERGWTLFTLDRRRLGDPKLLFEALRDSRLDFWMSTPSLAELCVQSEQFSEELLPELRRIGFCGEVLTKKLYRQLRERFPRATVVNTYGPTEATVFVTAAEMTDEMLAKPSLPIGYPLSTVSVRVAGPDGAALGEGEQGELVLIGDSVGPGYFQRPELTQKAFFTDPVSGKRAYRTGDLCYVENGCVYYCGRLDSQVKLNGYRVELEDVENNLVRVENVARAAVLPVLTDGKVSALTAFVLLEKPDGLSSLRRSQRIRAALGELVPAYMVPRRIVAVDAFPLNTNGKIDKKALAALLAAGSV